MFGSPETTPGGRALKFYASVRLDIRRIATIKDNTGRSTANRTKVKVKKNKVAPPFTEAEFDITFARGISWEGSVIDAALQYNLVEKRGSWFSYDGEQIGQGRDSAVQFLSDNPDICAKLVENIKAKHKEGA